jgi:hypothetical protein
MKLHDPLCAGCQNKMIYYATTNKEGKIEEKKIPCPHICPPIQWINGKSPRKENLLKDPEHEERRQRQDYNAVLAKLIKQKKINHIEEIREISNLTMRAIACMLWADISITDIAKITHCHRDTFYKKIASYRNKSIDL